MGRSSSIQAALMVLAVGIMQCSALDCPMTARFHSCQSNQCIEVASVRARTFTTVCNACEKNGYKLAHAGTKKATCECARGFAGENGVCIACPSGTHFALGGPIEHSECLRCPAGTVFSEERQDCLCSAGTIRVAANSVGKGFKHVGCKPCRGRNEFMPLQEHGLRSCRTCDAPFVANKDHTKCVPANNPDAVPAASAKMLGARAAKVLSDITKAATSPAIVNSPVSIASITGSPSKQDDKHTSSSSSSGSGSDRSQHSQDASAGEDEDSSAHRIRRHAHRGMPARPSRTEQDRQEEAPQGHRGGNAHRHHGDEEPHKPRGARHDGHLHRAAEAKHHN